MDAMLHIPDPAPYMTKQVIRASARQQPLQMLLGGETPPFWGATDHMRDYTCNHKNWTTLSLLYVNSRGTCQVKSFCWEALYEMARVEQIQLFQAYATNK